MGEPTPSRLVLKRRDGMPGAAEQRRAEELEAEVERLRAVAEAARALHAGMDSRYPDDPDTWSEHGKLGEALAALDP